MAATFEERVGRYLDELYGTALCFVGDEGRAESLLLEAVRAAFHRFRAGGDPSDPRLALLRILTRTHLERERRAAPGGGEAARRPGPSAPRPRASATSGDLEQAVRRAIGDLEPEPRMALWLVNVLGLRYRQAADCLDWPVERLTAALVTARRAVRDHLGEDLTRRLEGAS